MPVHYAAMLGHLLVLKWLWVRGISVDAKAFSLSLGTGITPLHLAAENGHQEVVEFILARNVPVDVQTSDGVYPIFSIDSASLRRQARPVGDGALFDRKWIITDGNLQPRTMLRRVRIGERA
jgi:ankyrin repeat protein